MICAWFAGCTNPVEGAIVHPILGEVPACARCAERAEQALVTLEGREDPLSIPCAECGAEPGEQCHPWCTGLDWIPDQDAPADDGRGAEDASHTTPTVTTT